MPLITKKLRLPSKSKVRKIFEHPDPEVRMKIIRNDNNLWLGFAYHFCRITPIGGGDLIPFKPNRGQYRFLQRYWQNVGSGKKPFQIIVSKMRQGGYSTLSVIIILIELLCRNNLNARLVTEVIGNTSNDASGGNILEMYANALEEMYQDLGGAPYKRNVTGSGFTLAKSGSSLSIAPQSRDARGVTLNIIHCSEVGFYQKFEETARPLLESEHNLAGNIILFESTSSGDTDDGYAKWYRAALEGSNEFETFHAPWYEIDTYKHEMTEAQKDDFRLRLNSNVNRYGDEKQILEDHPNCTLENLKWRRWCIDRTYLGNINEFKTAYPIDYSEAFSGKGAKVFDKRSIEWHRNFIQMTPRIGDMVPQLSGMRANGSEPAEFVDSVRGAIALYEEPQEFSEYVVGSDSAEGLKGADYSVGIIAKRQPFEIVAVIRGTETTNLRR